jgi:hypothetical protein
MAGARTFTVCVRAPDYVPGVNAQRPRHGSDANWRLRLRVRISRRQLDRRIARGCRLDESTACALRACQLTGAQACRTTAGLLANILDAAEECMRDETSPLIVQHGAVIESRDGILALIERLRSGSELAPRGLALARVLTQSPGSPIYDPSSRLTLDQALTEIGNEL